jgi:hypothetical protein
VTKEEIVEAEKLIAGLKNDLTVLTAAYLVAWASCQ